MITVDEDAAAVPRLKPNETFIAVVVLQDAKRPVPIGPGDPELERFLDTPEEELLQVLDLVLRIDWVGGILAGNFLDTLRQESAPKGSWHQRNRLIARRQSEQLDLTRFRGHLISWEKGVHDVENESALCSGVSPADG